MKKEYQNPTLTVQLLSNADIIITSISLASSYGEGYLDGTTWNDMT